MYDFAVSTAASTSGFYGGCSASHAECSKPCGDAFNSMWDDAECKPWITAFAARTPAMASDLETWVARCDVRRPELLNWLMIGGGITLLAIIMLIAVVGPSPPITIPTTV